MKLDDVDVEADDKKLLKDSQIRRRYLRWYNKRRADFATDREYDDYLEMVEEIISNMVNDIDVEATKARVEKYRRENQHLIGAIQVKRQEDERAEAERLHMLEQKRQQRLVEERQQDEERRMKEREERRRVEAANILRITKGEAAVRELERLRDRREKRKRRQEEAEAKERKRKKREAARNIVPVAFPNMPPVLADMSMAVDGRKVFNPNDPFGGDKERARRAASAGGFDEAVVRQRARTELMESLNFGMSQTVAGWA